jgi:hypothetical protein
MRALQLANDRETPILPSLISIARSQLAKHHLAAAIRRHSSLLETTRRRQTPCSTFARLVAGHAIPHDLRRLAGPHVFAMADDTPSNSTPQTPAKAYDFCFLSPTPS